MSSLAYLEELQQTILDWVRENGPLGVFIGMFLESSVVPIPSEIVLVTAGLIGIPPFIVAIYGGVGSTLGSIIGYSIGRYGGRPLAYRYGKYMFITETRLHGAERWFNHYGAWAILISRLLPFVPYKVFSVTAGVLKMDFKIFIIFTLIGSIPRGFLLASVGQLILIYQTGIIIAMALATIMGLIIYWIWKKRSKLKQPIT